jgi:hypothetical protein
VKTVELTDRELELLLDALAIHGDALNDSLVASGNPELADALTEVLDLETDLREMLHRDDGWDRENDAIPDAAAEFIQAGIGAREQVKESSRAATRRDELLARGVSNDPIDW